jgi:hypothetical protein
MGVLHMDAINRDSFVTPFLYMIGMTSGRTSKLWRNKLMDAGILGIST